MFIDLLLDKIQSSKLAKYITNSLFFENIDNISFVVLCLLLVSTAFAGSGYIGLLSACFVLLSVFKLLFNKGEKVNISFINKILIIYFLIVVISLCGSSLFVLSLKGFLKTVIYISFYFALCFYIPQNKEKIFPLLLVTASCATFEGIIAVIQNFSHIEAIATWQDNQSVSDATRIISRAYGTLKPYNPNLLAGYLVCTISSVFALFSLSYLKKNKKFQIISLVSFLVVFYAIFTTGSRGGYLGLFGFLGILFLAALIYYKKHFGSFCKIEKKYKIAVLGAVCAVIGLLFLVPSFGERVLSIFAFRKDSSISFRMNVYEACLQMLSDNTFLGIGVGNKNFREIYGLYMKTGFDALGAYSVPLEIAVESGIFALVFFALFIGLLAYKGVKYILNPLIKEENKIIVFSILLSIAGVMAHGLFDTVFFRPQIQILFFLQVAILHTLIKSE